MHYLVLFAIVFSAGLVPAFGPPSWLFAVYFHYQYHLPFAVVVLITALATSLGRLLLARLTRLLKQHIPSRYTRNLDYAKRLLSEKQKSVWLVMGLFLLSPLPSAQLFEAAGLIDLPLLPLGLMFFIGRLFTLSAYLAFARFTIPSLNNAWAAGFSSPWAIAGELITILGIIALLNSRWIITKLQKDHNKQLS